MRRFLLSVEDVCRLHRDIIAESGGCPGIVSLELLQAALNRVRASVQGKWLYDDVFLQAACVAHAIARWPFVDGNKRVALLVADAILSEGGWTFDASPDEQTEVMCTVAEGHMDVGDLAAWLRRNSRSE